MASASGAWRFPRAIGPGLGPDALAEAETAIASAVVIYAEQATGSRVPPARVSPLIFASPSLADQGAALAETAAASDPARRLADFNPPQKGYRDLKEESIRLLAPAPGGSEPAADLRAGPPPRQNRSPGETAGRRAHPYRLRRPCARVRRTRPRAGGDPRQHGDVALGSRATWASGRIEVNIPDFSVEMLEGDAIVQERADHRREAGNADADLFQRDAVRHDQSLMGGSQFDHQEGDSASRLARSQLPRRRGYEVKTIGGGLTVRQLPGEDNALGRIAFMFPERTCGLHARYARAMLFDADMRAFSHGCIRVEDPLSLAEVVLDGQRRGWTESESKRRSGDTEKTVFLPRPVPIHIEYFTEFSMNSANCGNAPDIYEIARRVGRHTCPGVSQGEMPRDRAIGDSSRFLVRVTSGVTEPRRADQPRSAEARSAGRGAGGRGRMERSVTGYEGTVLRRQGGDRKRRISEG